METNEETTVKTQGTDLKNKNKHQNNTNHVVYKKKIYDIYAALKATKTQEKVF
jgi:hypothetical protein